MTGQQGLPAATPPTITRERFIALLAASPAAEEAGRMYAAVLSQGLNPAVFLAFFHHESKFGTLGICKEYDTKNPGNVRSPEIPGLAPIIQTPRGPFARYPDWVVGTLDWCYRIKGPKYAGAGLTTVEQILPKYAPSSDSNDPQAYARAVVALVERWKEPMLPLINPPGSIVNKVQLIPPSNSNYSGLAFPGGGYSSVTIHNTGNPRPGTGAQMHANFVTGPSQGGPDGASYHATTDDRLTIQLLPYTHRGGHIGDGYDGPGGSTTLGMEICINPESHFPTACRRAAQWTVERLVARNLPAIKDQTVRQHGSWWTLRHPNVHKNCPAELRAGKDGVTWDLFFQMVLNRMPGAAPTPGWNSETAQRWRREQLLRAGRATSPAFGEPIAEGWLNLEHLGQNCVSDERWMRFERGGILHTFGSAHGYRGEGQVHLLFNYGPTGEAALRATGKMGEW